MTTRRALFNIVIERGLYVGGTPPFVSTGTFAARFVVNNRFDFWDPMFRRITHYLTMDWTVLTAGPTIIGGGNNWTLDYRNATRWRFPGVPAIVFRTILVCRCDSDPTDTYKRVYIAEEPVLL